MELDWKLIIALLALVISIYNLLHNRHMYKIEKKTIVLNELQEAQFMFTRLEHIFFDINNIELFENIEQNHEILKLKEENKKASEKLDYIFDIIFDNNNCDAHILETARPLIKKVSFDVENSYHYANTYKQNITTDASKKHDK